MAYEPHRALRERLSDSTDREYNRRQNTAEIDEQISEIEAVYDNTNELEAYNFFNGEGHTDVY